MALVPYAGTLLLHAAEDCGPIHLYEADLSPSSVEYFTLNRAYCVYRPNDSALTQYEF